MTECDGGHVLLLNKLQYFKEIVTPGIDFPGIRVRIQLRPFDTYIMVYVRNLIFGNGVEVHEH